MSLLGLETRRQKTHSIQQLEATQRNVDADRLSISDINRHTHLNERPESALAPNAWLHRTCGWTPTTPRTPPWPRRTESCHLRLCKIPKRNAYSTRSGLVGLPEPPPFLKTSGSIVVPRSLLCLAPHRSPTLSCRRPSSLGLESAWFSRHAFLGALHTHLFSHHAFRGALQIIERSHQVPMFFAFCFRWRTTLKRQSTIQNVTRPSNAVIPGWGWRISSTAQYGNAATWNAQ